MDGALSSQVVQALKPSPTNTACRTNVNAVLVCSLDIVINHCGLTASCENIADVKPYSCDPAKATAIIAGVATKLVSQDPKALAAFNDTLATSTVAYAPGADTESRLNTYITEKCSASITSVQSIVCPIVLNDCSDVSIAAVNQLDASASCGLSKTNELLQASGLGTRMEATPPKSPLRRIAVTIVVGCVAAFVAAILFGLLLRRKAAYQARLRQAALQQQQMLNALYPVATGR